jgi:opacity protein-like surface antigen
MKRVAGVVTFCLVSTLYGGAAAYAQTTAASGSTASGESRLYAEVNAGPTLGHKSDTFVGGEAGFRLMPSLDIYVEGGHMGNVANSQLDADAAVIATFVGGSVSSTGITANYFDAGIRYHLGMFPAAHPYLLLGAGAVKTTREVVFSVNGSPVDPATLGVQLGGDLSGSHTKTLIVAGGGINYPFMTRFYVDLGYRYGQILAKTGAVETDTSIKTQRVVVGVGVKF